METILALLSMIYMSTFTSQGYVYGSGYFAGTITSIEERGYIWKTLEGTIRSPKDPVYESIMKYRVIDCVGERDFSIEDQTIIPQLKRFMESGTPVVLYFNRVGRFMPYWHGDTRIFVTNVRPIK